MFTVRKVRVEDTKLRSIPYHPNGGPHEDVLLKAESQPQPGANDEGKLRTWASLHMNLDVPECPPLGKELMVVVADKPADNVFVGAFTDELGENGVGCAGIAVTPQGAEFRLSVQQAPNEIPARPPVTMLFTEEEAADFIQVLLHKWFGPGAAEGLDSFRQYWDAETADAPMEGTGVMPVSETNDTPPLE